MMKNERGFTIMELMVVIVIIGVLAAIGVPAYKSMIDRARKQACLANQRTISSAVAMYYVDNGLYKNGLVDLILGDLVLYLDNAESIKCPVKDAAAYTIEVNEDDSVEIKCDKHPQPTVYVVEP